jgi:predicted ATPase
MDILYLLLKSAGEPVGKRALEQFAWPDTFVHESNLKVHISSLRRALGETSPQPTYISTVSGRGYRFIPRVSIEQIVTAGALSGGAPLLHNLPPQRPPIGREREIDCVASMLERSRLVTLVGPGGVGKTTVALAAARRFHEEGVSSVVFVDLSRVASEEFVPASLAAALGISAGGDDSLHAVVSILARRTALLLLDTCEHVLTATVRICEVLLAKTGNVRILATSRQVLGAQREKVVWLAPLDLPPKEATTTQDILKYSACQLLATRASESADYHIADADARAIAEICRRVDGMPLAIELVSSRLALRSADGVLDELDDRFRTLRRQDPGSPLRQQTLLVTLEWSYALLTRDEATVLRAVSIFAGAFDASWAHVVVCPRRFASIDTCAIIDGLRAKSMLSMFVRSSGEPRYRLLDTTRAFAGNLLDSHGELAAVSADHARLQLEIFTRAGADQATLAARDWRETYLEQADDLRKAIDWALYRSGDVYLGIRLVAAGLPLWNELSLFDESRRNCERALSELERSGYKDPPLKLKLVVGLAGVYAYLSGDPQETIALFQTAIQLARDLSDASVECRALGALAIYYFLPGRHEELSETLRIMELAAMRSKDRAILWEYEQLCADLETTRGDFSASRSRLERLSAQMRNHAQGAAPRFHIHQTSKIDAHLAALYWFTGKPGRAQELTEQIAAEVVDAAHGMTLIRCFCYGVIFTLVQCHDYATARSHTQILKDTIYRHGMAAWIPVADVYSEAIQALSGDNASPDGLRSAFDQLREAMVQIRHPSYFVTLATAMMALGQVDDAARVVDYVFQQPTQPWVLPEVLRLQAAIERASGRDSDAEATLMRSLQLADETDALGWKLRAALDLAVLLKDHGAPADAQRILISVYDQFTDGFDSGDLRNARNFLKHVG